MAKAFGVACRVAAHRTVKMTSNIRIVSNIERWMIREKASFGSVISKL